MYKIRLSKYDFFLLFSIKYGEKLFDTGLGPVYAKWLKPCDGKYEYVTVW